MFTSLLRSMSVLLLLVFLSGCPVDKDNRLTQYATLEALAGGIYDGDLTIGDLKKKGDFGLGTFNTLDGEMVMVDGVVYQARSDGAVVVADEDLLTPFAVTLPFQKQFEVGLPDGLDFTGLTTALDAALPSTNFFAAIRIDGVFPELTVRTVPQQEKPYKPLTEVLNDQVVTQVKDVEGTLIILRMPLFVGAINATGYHMHFLSSNHHLAGHVLALRTSATTAAVDVVPNWVVELPTTGDFLTAPLDGSMAEKYRGGALPIL